jgi:hypothetical protein
MYLDNVETVTTLSQVQLGTADSLNLISNVGGLWTSIFGAITVILAMIGFSASSFTTTVMDKLYLAKKSETNAAQTQLNYKTLKENINFNRVEQQDVDNIIEDYIGAREPFSKMEMGSKFLLLHIFEPCLQICCKRYQCNRQLKWQMKIVQETKRKF